MSMLSTYDPAFRDLDRLMASLVGSSRPGWGPKWMPADVVRQGDKFIAKFDVAGAQAGSIEVTVEKNVLSVSAERDWAPDQEAQVLLAERPHGRFSRQIVLGEDLEADNVSAQYHEGVLTVTIPLAERAKPRKVQVTSGPGQQAINTSSNSN